MGPVDNLCPKVKSYILVVFVLEPKYKSSAIKKQKENPVSCHLTLRLRVISLLTHQKQVQFKWNRGHTMHYSAIGLFQWPFYFAILATKFTAPAPTARWYRMDIGQKDITTSCGRIA